MASNIVSMNRAEISRPLVVSIPGDYVQAMVQGILDLSSEGEIRTTEDGLLSVLDLIGTLGQKENPSKTWKRLLGAHSDTIPKCQSVKFPRSDGKSGSMATPVTDIAGCLEIIWMLPGEISKKMRRIGARINAVVIEQATQPQPSAPMTQAQALLASVQIIADIEQKQLQQEARQREHDARLAIAEQESQLLRQQLADIQQKQLAAQEELLALPPSARDVPQESTDMKIRRLVNNYCAATGNGQREVWINLYQQFNLRYHRIIKPMDGESKLQCFIRMGLIEALYALAVDMLASKTALQLVR